MPRKADQPKPQSDDASASTTLEVAHRCGHLLEYRVTPTEVNDLHFLVHTDGLPCLTCIQRDLENIHPNLRFDAQPITGAHRLMSEGSRLELLHSLSRIMAAPMWGDLTPLFHDNSVMGHSAKRWFRLLSHIINRTDWQDWSYVASARWAQVLAELNTYFDYGISTPERQIGLDPTSPLVRMLEPTPIPGQPPTNA